MTVIKAGTQVVQVRTQHTAFRGTSVIFCFLLLAPAQGTDPLFLDGLDKSFLGGFGANGEAEWFEEKGWGCHLS